ncbi:unnamed protein product [Rotaria socialis]|uniref:Uncharacterized protein n=1 Tax=Rotaria socialis TaxID=392032 RepID=A0A818JIR5_9BILA|nr:unnamed protein product [Rotaria socialis]CAF4479558.1 unnamed protein product [Rotaria socialis]
MIDPRFANAGALPLVPGFGTQQVPMQYHQQPQPQRHHRHHKNKARKDESPVSRDESIHKVDHGQPNFLQNNDMPLGSGYGVPYGVTGFGASGAAGFHQQQQFSGGNFGYTNQYQTGPYGQVPQFGGPVGQPVKQHRRHHRHRRQEKPEETNNAHEGDQEQGVPEQLIGQRSTSAMSNEGPKTRSPAPDAESEVAGAPAPQSKNRRHRHRQQNVEQTNFGQAHQSRQKKCHTLAGADGYGHINDDLIFIERGDHSPHRQEPPPGFEYKGTIEVQGIDKEYRSRSRGSAAALQPSVPVHQSSIPISQPAVPTPSMGPCPPGWQQMMLTAGSCGPCPSGGLPYTGHTIGAMGGTQPGFGSFGGVGSFGLTGAGNGFGNFGPGLGGGFGNFGAGASFPSQCQFVADYIFGSNTGATSTPGGTGFTNGYQRTGGTGVTEQFKNEQVEEHASDRPTIIEVWQRRSKSVKHTSSRPTSPHRSPSQPGHGSHSPTTGPSFDFERFRKDILNAIERMAPRGGSGFTDTQPTGRDGGTQTQIPPTPDEPPIRHGKSQQPNTGEVRVIVQPIQPVFYMPRQTEGTAPQQHFGGGFVGPAPAIQQQTSTGAANIIYIPRNVYVPVVKPVFVPRERVIVRPQVIHVARPVLVDRPVPVTQRPIIIDRERPVPVPVRGAGQEAASTGGSKIIREEYVYRDNLPVAYGGRFPEFAGGVNYGYMPTEQEHQYASSSTHETSNIYQTQAPVINVNVPNQFQHSQSVSQFEGQQGINENFHGSYANLAATESSYPAAINNDYLATQQEQQYANTSTHETGNMYQTEGPVINVNVQNQYQHSQSASHLTGQDATCQTFEGSYSDLVGSSNGMPLNVDQRNQDVFRQVLDQSAQISGVPLHGPTQIEVLDTAVNPSWQKTDQSALMRRYGRPAFEIVHKSEEIEQQMYNELRQRTSSTGIVRSSSTASYASGSGIGAGGMVQY